MLKRSDLKDPRTTVGDISRKSFIVLIGEGRSKGSLQASLRDRSRARKGVSLFPVLPWAGFGDYRILEKLRPQPAGLPDYWPY